MSAKFYTLLTDIGAAKLASAAALGVPLKITQMAVGDGGGVLPTPSAQQTKLVSEKRRADLNMLYIDPQNSSQIIAEQVIPETEGGWWIREVGLFDETGALIAVGNCPESYKPQLAEGSGRTQTVRMVLITSSTDNITLKIDPSVVLATRKYVDDKVLELKVYVDELMAAHLAAADPHTQYAPKASPTFTGTPKAPTAAAGNNTTQLATTAFVQAALIALVNGAPATLDTLKEIAAAINNDPNFSTTINNALALKAPLASPALTGTPTAPTAAQTVNNTQIATTAFVKSALAALVGSSPAALDTLNELAAALGNDPNFATTMTNALAGKQPLDSTLTTLSGKTADGIIEYLQLVGGLGSSTVGRLVGVQVITSSGMYTPTPGAKFGIGRGVGGGAGGGGSSTPPSGQVSSAAGGNSGSYGETKFTITGPISVTIGAGGNGGTGSASSTGANIGGAGGDTIFGTIMTCPGGRSGLASNSFTVPSVCQSIQTKTAPCTGANIVSIDGEAGGQGLAIGTGLSGRGGGNPLGSGGNHVGSGGSLSVVGNNGAGYGSGGSGAFSGSSGAGKAGGNGAPGVIIIMEYA
ncbi:phage tail protein [Escherichia coli]|uniref:phage tail protein n=7 Tax=Enterobacteriaceae TaxID=543 RepID=UPI002DBD325F|nr:phage tail protein [Escherichia coli]MEC3818210.1 phage tail protein [Escherichia coli]HCQ8893652.1 phage tail protein [Escherichia coli]